MSDIIVNDKLLRLHMTVPASVLDKIQKELKIPCTPLSTMDGGQNWCIYAFVDPLKEEEFLRSLNGNGYAPAP